MTHVDDESHDFEGLDNLGFSKKITDSIKKARMLAREIIDSLEPRHIYGFNSLKIKLEHALLTIDTESKLIEIIEREEKKGEI